MASIEEKVTKLVEPIIENLGYELYDVEYAKEGKNYFLRIFIDNEKGIDLNDIENADLSLLIDESEKNIIFFMSMYPMEILKSAINYDPTKITRYVISLATLFHKFYSSCKVISEDAELTKARLYLCETVRILIKDVLDMFKVEAPEAMN